MREEIENLFREPGAIYDYPTDKMIELFKQWALEIIGEDTTLESPQAYYDNTPPENVNKLGVNDGINYTKQKLREKISTIK